MIRPALVIGFLLISLAGISQQKITGLVEDDAAGSPVSYASVTSEKGPGIMTDSSGKFSFVIRKQARLNDSILVSAIGYSPKRIAIKDLLGNNKVKLSQTDRILEEVKVFASLKGDYNDFN